MKYRGRQIARRTRIPRYITPDQKLVKLRYCFTKTHDPGSGGTSWISVCANDLLDPQLNQGHSPMGFDQCMALYDRFCVVGSKITAVIQGVGQANHAHLYINGIALRPTTTLETAQASGGVKR
jgi:hypothetical protein